MIHDSISRQSAVDIVLEYAKRLSEHIGTPKDNEMYAFGRGLLIGIERNLKQLPSAQSEAKPPKFVAEDRYVKNHFIVSSHCPQCDAEVKMGQCYCLICGQHIDWSEDGGD